MPSRWSRHAAMALLLYGGFTGAVSAGTPCCEITAIDKKTGVVTARQLATKQSIRFRVDNAVVLNRIAVGQKVDVAADRASIEGVSGRFRVIAATPPLSRRPGAAPGAAPPARATKACCVIASVDAKSGVVTARESASGRSFTFAVSDAKAARELRAGQPVHAHFASKQVSLDGRKPCCRIMSLATGETSAPPPGRMPSPLGKKGMPADRSMGAPSDAGTTDPGAPAQSETTEGWGQGDPGAGVPSDSSAGWPQDGYSDTSMGTQPPSDYGSAYPSDADAGYPADAGGSGYPADAGGSGYYPGQQSGTQAPQPADAGKRFSYGTGEAPIQGDVPWWKQPPP